MKQCPQNIVRNFPGCTSNIINKNMGKTTVFLIGIISLVAWLYPYYIDSISTNSSSNLDINEIKPMQIKVFGILWVTLLIIQILKLISNRKKSSKKIKQGFVKVNFYFILILIFIIVLPIVGSIST